MEEPILKQFGVTFDNNTVKEWTYSTEVAHDILRDFRYLIEHDEYELDGTENREESLQERPSACERCGGQGWTPFSFANWGKDVDVVCAGCKGTGVDSRKEQV
jgi:DnaJ-class molecular chaperone